MNTCPRLEAPHSQDFGLNHLGVPKYECYFFLTEDLAVTLSLTARPHSPGTKVRVVGRQKSPANLQQGKDVAVLKDR